MMAPPERSGVARVLLSALAALAATGSTSCTVLSDFEVRQCSVDVDCDLLGGSVQYCESGRCSEGCRDNHQCATLDPGAPICQYSGGRCVSLSNETGECYTASGYSEASMGALTGRDLLLVGAFAPRLRSSATLTLELAVSEIATAGGILSLPLLVVMCSDRTQDVPAAMAHLVNDLHVHTLLAALDDEALSIAVNLPGVDDALLFLSPNGYGAKPSEGSGRVWYLGAPYGKATKASLSVLTQIAVARQPALAGRRLRIAVVAGALQEDAELAAATLRDVELDGLTALDLEARDGLRSFLLGDAPSARAAMLDALASYAPDVIVWYAAGTFAEPQRAERSSFLAELEARAAALGNWSPIYLIGTRNLEDSSIQALVASSVSFRDRAIALMTNRAFDLGALRSLRERFSAAFPRASASANGVAAIPQSAIYDAVYYLAYAGAAARTSEASARAGLLRIIDPAAEAVTAGAWPIDAADELLRTGAAVNLSGTSGPANFLLDVQARPAEPSVYCWQPDTGNLLELPSLDALNAKPTPCARGVLDAAE